MIKTLSILTENTAASTPGLTPADGPFRVRTHCGCLVCR
jgi:hypothetical protein